MTLPVTITGISTAVAPVGPFKVAAGNYAQVAIDTGATLQAGNNVYGGAGTEAAQGQSLTNGASSLTPSNVVLYIYKTGTPTDNFYIEITSTNPSGSVLATSDLISATTITATTGATAQATTFTFASPPTISASATFGVRIWRTGSRDTSNYISIAAQAANVYAGGSTWSYNGITTTWAAGSVDAKVIVNSSITLATDAYYFFGRDGTTATTLQAYKASDPSSDGAIYTIASGITIGFSWGADTFSVRYYQTFTTGSSTSTIKTVTLGLGKTGSPTDNLQVDIYALDGSSLPTGSSLGTSAVIAGSTLTTSGVRYTFTFATPVSVSSSTKYAAVISRSGAVDAVNYYALYRGGTSNLDAAQGSGGYNSGTTVWSASAADYDLIVSGGGFSSIATRTGFTTAILNIAGYQVGNVIHLAVQDGTMASSVATKYLSFDAATDTFLASTETVLAASSIATAGGGNAGQNCSLVVRSNGNVVLFYNGTQAKVSGTFYANVWYRERTGVNTYGTAVQVSALTAVDYTNPVAVLGSSDRTHFLFFSVTTINQRHLTSANTLGTATTNAIASPILDACTYNNAGTTKVVALTSGRAIRFDSADNPSIASSTSVTMGTPVRATDDGTDVYALYQSSTDSDLYTKKSTDNGATFGSAVSAFVGTVTAADANVSKNQLIYQRGSNVVIPYLVNDNSVLKYNEYVVRTLGPTGYTLTAATGAFAFTGVAATLKTSRQLPTTVGAFALTGIDATFTKVAATVRLNAVTGAFNLSGTTTYLVRPLTMPTVTGAFTLSGTAILSVAMPTSVGTFTTIGIAAALKFARGFPAVTGSFTLSGKTANLLAARRLSVTVGTFTTTGIAAQLFPTRRLLTTVGPFNFTGIDANLFRRINSIMPAATGAFTVSGIATSLKFNHVLKANAGAFTYAGQTAGLKFSHRLVSNVTPYTMVGVAAGLIFSRVLGVSAGTGVFNLSGKTVTFRNTYAVKATTGTFTLNGIAANLKAGHVLTASTTPFTLSGQAATLKRIYVMPAATGAFALAGQTATLKRTYVMPTSVGAFALSGQAATLKRIYVMPAATGAFTLSGQAATLRAGRTLAVTNGSFTLNGVAANFRTIRALVTVKGSFTLTGTAANLRIARVLVAAKASFTLNGINAILKYTRVMPVTKGTFALNGVTVNLVYSNAGIYSMPALPGVFTLSGKSALFRNTYAVRITTTTFALSGSTANLTATRRLPTTTGSFAFTGVPVGLKSGRKSQVAAAAFIFSGKDVILVKTGAVLTGVNVWNGSGWAVKPVKVWTGAAWQQKPVKTWDGSVWQ